MNQPMMVPCISVHINHIDIVIVNNTMYNIEVIPVLNSPPNILNIVFN